MPIRKRNMGDAFEAVTVVSEVVVQAILSRERAKDYVCTVSQSDAVCKSGLGDRLVQRQNCQAFPPTVWKYTRPTIEFRRQSARRLSGS